VTEPRRNPRKTPTAAQSAQKQSGHPRILVVDDEPMITSILSRLIGKDHVVFVSHSSVEAKDRLSGGERFDAILCDLMMPELSGVDLHAEITQFAPDQAAKMIFMTGGAFTDVTRAFLDRVPNPRVEKPFDVGLVREAIRNVLIPRT
jgi:two-component system, NtrC family, sensor kinase